MRGRVDEAQRLLRQAQEGPADVGMPEHGVVMRVTLELRTLRTTTTNNATTGLGGPWAPESRLEYESIPPIRRLREPANPAGDEFQYVHIRVVHA